MKIHFHPHRRTKRNITDPQKTPDNEKFERCVMCGKLTNVPVLLCVDLREDYEIGCGQLCNACQAKLRNGSK